MALFKCNSLPLEPFGEGIPTQLLGEFSFVRPPAQAAYRNGKSAELTPILFPFFPYFEFYSRLTNSHVLLHCRRHPFCGPALLAAFHNSLGVPTNDKQDLWRNRKQIREGRGRECKFITVIRSVVEGFRRESLRISSTASLDSRSG